MKFKGFQGASYSKTISSLARPAPLAAAWADPEQPSNARSVSSTGAQKIKITFNPRSSRTLQLPVHPLNLNIQGTLRTNGEKVSAPSNRTFTTGTWRKGFIRYKPASHFGTHLLLKKIPRNQSRYEMARWQ